MILLKLRWNLNGFGILGVLCIDLSLLTLLLRLCLSLLVLFLLLGLLSLLVFGLKWWFDVVSGLFGLIKGFLTFLSGFIHIGLQAFLELFIVHFDVGIGHIDVQSFEDIIRHLDELQRGILLGFALLIVPGIPLLSLDELANLGLLGIVVTLSCLHVEAIK